MAQKVWETTDDLFIMSWCCLSACLSAHLSVLPPACLPACLSVQKYPFLRDISKIFIVINLKLSIQLPHKPLRMPNYCGVMTLIFKVTDVTGQILFLCNIS